MNFSDIVKNENTVKIIRDMIKFNKIPGTFIFEGEQENDKNLISNVLAKAVVCQNNDHKKEFGDSCGVCDSCVKAEKNIHPDIIVPEPDGEGALSYHIKKVREDIIDGLYLTPNESDKKVYIIKDMQNMTPQGQNALLKSIEEPPPFVVFIITVNSSDLILETVKSRSVKFTMDYNDYADKSKTSKKIQSNYGELIFDILAENPDKLAIYQKLLTKGLEKSDKTEVLTFYSYLENALRDILVAKIFMSYENPENSEINSISFIYFNNFNDLELLKKLANLYSAKKILSLSKKIHKYKADLDYNINIRLNLTSFLSSLSI